MTATILITRPEPDASAFAERLRNALGDAVPVIVSPLMRIETLDADLRLEDIKHLIFTSRNGVRAFEKLSDRRDLPCFCVGRATAEAARRAGMAATPSGGDAKALVAQMMGSRPSGRCLHLRGEHAIGNVAQKLTSAGIETFDKVIYRQVAQPLSAEGAGLMKGATPVIAPLFSPRSARLLFEAWTGSAPILVAAISRNVAAALPANIPVTVARMPDSEAVADILPRLIERANQLEGGNRAQ